MEDFDPEAHDRRMHNLFSDEFYALPDGDQKPEFPELDKELELGSYAPSLPSPAKKNPNYIFC